MPKIFKEYLYQRYVEDIIIYSFTPLIVVTAIAVRMPIDLNFVFAVFVNYLMYVFAFMYNDVEDRVEDAQSPGKRFKNPFGYKVWSLKFGYLLLGIITLISLVISYLIGSWLLAGIAFSNILAGIVYSSKMLRLKDWPIVDVLSHAYLLAGVTILYFMALPGAMIDNATLFILAGASLFSLGGDLLNEFRDFEDDQAAGLRNSAYYLGKKWTKRAQILAWSGAAILIGLGVLALIWR